jgi:hypothetical protein
MRLAILAVVAMALTPLAARAQYYVVISRPPAHLEPSAAPGQATRFHSTLDQVFGPGRWRQTSGYRSPEREDELRREGAGTVAAGHLSRHSLGGPDAPGAYDVVVAGMSFESAAEKLRSSGAGLARVIAERAHGAQGPHLHIEPGSGALALAAPMVAPAAPVIDPADGVYLRVVDGQRNPVLARASRRIAAGY